MTTTELINILSRQADLPVTVCLNGYVSEEDPRDGHNQGPDSLTHYSRLSSRRILSTADVHFRADPKSGAFGVEIDVRILVDPDTGERGGPGVSVGMMGADEVPLATLDCPPY